MSFEKPIRLFREGQGSITYTNPTGGGGNVYAPGINGVVAPVGSVILATCILRPSVTAGVVSWDFLNDSEHQTVFFNSVSQDGERIAVGYPNVTKVLSFLVGPDETFATQLTGAGATVANNTASIQLGGIFKNYSMAYVGNGTTLTIPAGLPNIFIGDELIGEWTLLIQTQPGNLPLPFNNYNLYKGVYNGPNPYYVKKLSSGLGIYNVGFQVIDPATGLAPAAPPTSNDWLFLDTGNVETSDINAYDPNNPWWASAFSNLWVMAAFQL